LVLEFTKMTMSTENQGRIIDIGDYAVRDSPIPVRLQMLSRRADGHFPPQNFMTYLKEH